MAKKHAKSKPNKETKAKKTARIKPFQWKKGESGNPKGRAKKYITTLAEQGYTRTQVNDTMMVMLQFNKTELKECMDNENATMLERILAKALFFGSIDGSLISIETILSRVLGKPHQSTELTGKDGKDLFPGVDLSNKTTDEILKIIAAADKALGNN